MMTDVLRHMSRPKYDGPPMPVDTADRHR